MQSPSDSPHPLPLAGVRILELANVVAGPSIGAHLSDFGAEVVKVERPGEGDASRTMGDAVGERTAWWLCIGRNKQTVALDLKREADRTAFLRLAGEADAVVESFRPGVMERLGLGPERLHEVNPRLVVVRISAFGQTGPYAHRPGFGTLAEAFSGLAEISGYPDRPPLLPPIALADQAAGLFGTWALLAALYHRDVHGGPGQTIDVSLYESVLSLLGPLPTLYRHNGTLLQRHGSRLSFSSPRNVYRTRDGRFFAVSGTAPSAAERVVRIVGGEALLADPRFATPAARADNADELDDVVADWIAAHDLADVEARFHEHNAAGIRVIDMADAAADPHYAARETIVAVPDEELGEVLMTAPVPRMSATPGRIAHAGRALGADTAAVCAHAADGRPDPSPTPPA
jgi:crotonobetainyl-CoA:carnitine CoA-transferase CaiB-like acyl-CoA transferase